MTRFPKTPDDQPGSPLDAVPSARTDVMAMHFDFNTAGLRLLSDPLYPTSTTDPALNIAPNLSDAAKKEIKVMVLLKV
jgi:hypothetical protein